MKILLICGSPRNGNTQAMLEKVAEGARKAGAETEMVLLRKLDIRQCDGCMACEKKGECKHTEDYMKGLLDKALGADAIVFGTPTYFNNVSTLFKIFMDRTVHLLYSQSELVGKPYAIVAVGSEPMGAGSIEKCEEIVKEFAEIHKMRFSGAVLASAEAPKDIEKDEAKMKECIELGKRLANL